MQGFIIFNDTNLSRPSIKVYLYLRLFFEGFGYHVHKAGSNVLILNAIRLLKKRELIKKQDIYLTKLKVYRCGYPRSV